MKIFNYLKRHAGITFQKLLPEIKITGIYSTRKLFSSEHKCGGESDPGCCHHNPNMNQNNVNEMAVRGILKEIKSEDGKSIEVVVD